MQVPRIAISNRMVDGWTLAILIQLSKALNLAKITQLCDLNITHIGNTYLQEKNWQNEQIVIISATQDCIETVKAMIKRENICTLESGVAALGPTSK